MKRLITSNVHEYGQKRTTGSGNLEFDEDGISQEIEDAVAEKLCKVSKSLSVHEDDLDTCDHDADGDGKIDKDIVDKIVSTGGDGSEGGSKDTTDTKDVTEESEEAIDTKIPSQETIDTWAKELDGLKMDEIKEMILSVKGTKETKETLERFTMTKGKKFLIEYAAPYLAANNA